MSFTARLEREWIFLSALLRTLARVRTIAATSPNLVTDDLEAVNIFTYGGEAAAEYPMNVYAGWFRNFMTFVVPVGCVTYLPMLAAMGRADPLGAPGWLTPLAPLAGFAFLGASLFIWGFGVRRYASAGG